MDSDCVEPQSWLETDQWCHVVVLQYAQCQCLGSRWLLNSQSLAQPGSYMAILRVRLLLGPWSFHCHASTNHSWITPVSPHPIWSERRARSTQAAQRTQDGTGTPCSTPWSSSHAQSLHLVQQVEVVDSHANVRLAFAVPPSLPASHPPRNLLQNGAGRFRGQEIIVGWALEVEARRGWHSWSALFCGRIWRGRGA